MKLLNAAVAEIDTAETLAGRTFLVEHLDRPVGSKRYTLLNPGESGAQMLAMVLATEKRARGKASITEVVA